MFKISWGGTSAKFGAERKVLNTHSGKPMSPQSPLTKRFAILRQQVCARVRPISCLALTLLAPGLTGCRSLSVHIPAANLQESGWTVRQGQAVWRIPTGSREIAGEVLVATKPDGGAFVQFTKSPFPLVIAQATHDRWEIEFPPQNKHYSGRGAPPKRIIWLYLPRMLQGRPPPRNWTWKEDSSGWQLRNGSNGEAIEGYFDP